MSTGPIDRRREFANVFLQVTLWVIGLVMLAVYGLTTQISSKYWQLLLGIFFITLSFHRALIVLHTETFVLREQVEGLAGASGRSAGADGVSKGRFGH